MKRFLFVSFCIFNLTLFLIQVPFARAEIQVDVSGNGADTQNTVAVTQTISQENNQSNKAEETSALNQSSNTGGNEITDTSNGVSAIQTGDIKTETQVTDNLNSSVLVVDSCCDANQSFVVSGNGDNSQNTISGNINVSTAISITNVATVTNIISGVADTGNNVVEGNMGAVNVATGDIYADMHLVTGMNNSVEKVSHGIGDIFIKISGNGVDSKNDISFRIFDSLLLERNNQAVVINDISLDLNTGKNTVSDTVGNVSIKTGDITSIISIINDPINSGETIITCCEKEEEKPPVVPPPIGGDEPKTTPNNSSKSSDGTSGGSGGGSVLAALSDILPATGLSAAQTMKMWIVMYLVMFLTGLYVRLRAGRSPAFIRI